jgi:hypothetical protein
MARKVSTEAINTVLKVLTASPVNDAISGQFFKRKKPNNFKGECIVIAALAMTKDQLQVCRVMVNAFVPNLAIKVNKETDRSQQDEKRLGALATLIDEALNDYDQDDISLRIEDESVIENDGFDEHYSNNRVVYRNVNI